MPTGGRRALGGGLMVGGAMAVIAGILVLAGVFDDDAPAEQADTAVPSTTAPPSSTTSTTAAPETPEEFVDDFVAAVQAGDITYLSARLHPAVITRYGEDQCDAYLPAVVNRDFELTIREVSEPEPYEWATDGVTTTVDDTFAVEVSRQERGETIIQEIHVARVGAEVRWFTDCGDPV